MIDYFRRVYPAGLIGMVMLMAVRVAVAREYSTQLMPYTSGDYPDLGLKDEVSDLGHRARGFYIIPRYLERYGPKKIGQEMRAAHVNAVVFDVKDDAGQLMWDSHTELGQLTEREKIKDPRQMVQAFHDEGIYVIARIVSFKDSLLSRLRPDLSVRAGASGRWRFFVRSGWIDAYSREVQDYLIDIAREWEAFGVDEVQFDYIRFPKGRGSGSAKWIHRPRVNPPTRAQLIAGFLERADRALGIPISADVYGLTTLVDGDPRGLGQDIQQLSPFVEAISPMMYAKGMRAYFGSEAAFKAGIYKLIQCGLWRARAKAPHVILRPYLQSYPNGVRSFFYDRSHGFIARQIRAVERAGASGLLFWNPYMPNQQHNRSAKWGLMSREVEDLDSFGENAKDPDAYNMGEPPANFRCPAAGEGHVFGN